MRTAPPPAWPRRGLLLGVLLVLGLTLAAPAGAVGTDDVELTPLLARSTGGSFVLTPAEEAGRPQAVRVRNLSEEPKAVTIYSVTADRGEGGATQLGDVGSASWIGVTSTALTLPPGGEERLDLALDLRRSPRGTHTVALVLESQAGPNLTLQAAQLIEVRPGLPPASPWPLYLLAALLLVGLTAAHVRQVRERSRGRRSTVAMATA
jgi:hypothetical protein